MSFAERITGTVKWFSNEKGYGFITPDPAAVSNLAVAIPEDIFVHQSTIHSEGFRTLGEGWKVEFRICQDEQGKVRAEEVTAVGGGPCTGPRKPRRRFRSGNDNRTNNNNDRNDDNDVRKKSAGAAKKRGKAAVMWHQNLKDAVKESLDEKGISRKNGTLNVAFGDARMKLGINSYASLVHKDKIIAEGSFSSDEEGEGVIVLDWKRAIEFDNDSQSWKVKEEIGNLLSELKLSDDDIQAVQKGENIASITGQELPDPKSVLEEAGFQMRRVLFYGKK